MGNVGDSTVRLCNLSHESKNLLNELQLSFDELLLWVRRGDPLPCDSVMLRSNSHKFLANREQKRALAQLRFEAKTELSRLGMIRDFSSKRFQLSANIFALRQMIAERSSRGLSWYYDSGDYLYRLIHALDNKTYETWHGYDDRTIGRIRALLKGRLTDIEYGVICMRFGLFDGICHGWQAIAKRFGWGDKGGPMYYERSAIKKLYDVTKEFTALTELASA